MRKPFAAVGAIMLFVLLVCAVAAVNIAGPKLLRMHYVVGRDVSIDGRDAFTVESIVSFDVNTRSPNDMRLKKQAARQMLKGRIDALSVLSQEAQSKYRGAWISMDGAPCSPDALSKPVIMDVPDDDCKFGDPDCPNWRTYMPGPFPTCQFAAVDCQRVGVMR